MRGFGYLLLAALVLGNAVGFMVTLQKHSSSSLQMTVLSHNGKKKNFKPGSPLKNACSALGVRPKYSCKK